MFYLPWKPAVIGHGTWQFAVWSFFFGQNVSCSSFCSSRRQFLEFWTSFSRKRLVFINFKFIEWFSNIKSSFWCNVFVFDFSSFVRGLYVSGPEDSGGNICGPAMAVATECWFGKHKLGGRRLVAGSAKGEIASEQTKSSRKPSPQAGGNLQPPEEFASTVIL